MLDHKVVESEQSSALPATQFIRGAVDIPNAAPVRLQTLDLTRHIAVAPNEKRYVVATFDDRHLGRGYVTAVYPQQNGYLTLIRLVICEISSETVEQAVQKHIELVQTIQQGKFTDFLQSLQK